MNFITVNARVPEGVVKEIDEIAEKTGTTRSDVLNRCIRLGLVEERNFASMGPLAVEALRVLTSEPFVSVITKLSGVKIDPKQVERVNEMSRKRKQAKAMAEQVGLKVQ